MNLTPDQIKEINKEAKAGLKALLDDAESRNYSPPVPGLTVAVLEYIIDVTSNKKD